MGHNATQGLLQTGPYGAFHPKVNLGKLEAGVPGIGWGVSTASLPHRNTQPREKQQLSCGGDSQGDQSW